MLSPDAPVHDASPGPADGTETAGLVGRVRELERENAELEAFAFRVSHDIRAPLSSGLGLIGLARDSVEHGDRADALEIIDRVGASLGRLDLLAGELLDTVRADGAAGTPARIDVSELLDDVIGRLAFMNGFERVELHRSIDPDAAPVCAPGPLRQVLQNLVSNAIKYADPNEDRPFVRVSSYGTCGNGSVVLEVADNGIGFPPSSVDEMFGMFKRFHPRIAAGDGLGLYLVARGARELGGHVRHDVTADGSTFTLTLPGTISRAG